MTSPSHCLAIIGAGGHGAVVLDAALSSWPRDRIAVFDKAPCQEALLGIAVSIGQPDPLSCPPSKWQILVAIGDNDVRSLRTADLRRFGYRGATVVHPSATISTHARLGEGGMVMANAVMNARAELGAGCIVNSGAIVEHDVQVGEFSHISPGAVIAGGAQLGRHCWIGANAVVKQGVFIGDGVVLGAGGFAGSNLTKPGVYVGAPARPVKR